MNSTNLKCIFLGFLMATLGLTAFGRPGGTDTEVGISYLDHSVDPNVILGIREHGSQYTYMVQVHLVSYGDTYTSTCEVNRVQLEDHEWCVEDPNPWVPYKPRHIKARHP